MTGACVDVSLATGDADANGAPGVAGDGYTRATEMAVTTAATNTPIPNTRRASRRGGSTAGNAFERRTADFSTGLANVSSAPSASTVEPRLPSSVVALPLAVVTVGRTTT